MQHFYHASMQCGVVAPRAWNQLLTDFKFEQSTTVFRRHLKTCLFNRAFCTDNTV